MGPALKPRQSTIAELYHIKLLSYMALLTWRLEQMITVKNNKELVEFGWLLSHIQIQTLNLVKTLVRQTKDAGLKKFITEMVNTHKRC